MACPCVLGARLSGGEGSRIEVDRDKLVEAGWSVDKKGKSYTFVSPSPEEKKFKSSKDVLEHLRERDEVHMFVRCNCGAAAAIRRLGDDSSELDTDEDYLPCTDEKAGVSSAYDDTPVKADC